MAESAPPSSLGKRAHDGGHADGTTDVDGDVNIEVAAAQGENEDSDEDVGPMPMPDTAAPRKKRKGELAHLLKHLEQLS